MKKSRTAFILLSAAIVISGIFFSFYVKSKISLIAGLRSSIEDLYRSDNLIIDGDHEGFKKLKRLFPETCLTTEFIEDAYRISKRYSVKNITFEHTNREFIELSSGRRLKALPASGQNPKVIYSCFVKINFNSGYRNMAEFVRELQNQDRLVTIENLEAEQDKESLAVRMVVNIYSTGAK